ncbi:MAG: cation:proton antiporter regulatory subunit [Frankia sp.]
MQVERTRLPGIGLRYEFATRRGQRIGVIAHRGGARELVVYDAADPDTSRDLLVLSEEESDVLAELLGAPTFVERLADLHREIDGLTSVQLPVPAGSLYDGRTLGDTRARTRTGASVVAVVRAGDVIASPRPDFRFAGGDVVVVIGTAEGTAAVADLLASG